VRLTVDGTAHEIPDAAAGQSLLRVLRDVLGITNAKNACEQGECGSCTVSIDGEIACACLVLATQADGAEIETARSLEPALPEAFLEAGAVQCGFCTPGLLVAARDLLARNPAPSDADIREGLNGNLCRCTGYTKIVEAVRRAAAAGEGAS
jgi:aerobic carbon-monoxide dehydrogenase small subunit